MTLYTMWDGPRTQDEVGGRNAYADVTYLIQGPLNETDARAELKAGAAATYSNLVVQSYSVDPIPGVTNLHRGVVRYGFPDSERTQEPKDTNEEEQSFDTTGRTAHITDALDQVIYDLGGSKAAPVTSAINIGIDGQVEGIDVVIPTLRWQIKRYHPDADVTNAYIRDLAELTGRTNDATFRGFEPEEVLYLGVSGNQRGRGDWGLTHYFEAAASSQYGQHLVSFTKKGWHHVWTYFTEKDGANNTIETEAIGVYDAQIYPTGDFSKIKL